MGSEEALKVVSQRRFHCRYGHNEPLCISRQAYSIKGFQVPLQNWKPQKDTGQVQKILSFSKKNNCYGRWQGWWMWRHKILRFLSTAENGRRTFNAAEPESESLTSQNHIQRGGDVSPNDIQSNWEMNKICTDCWSRIGQTLECDCSQRWRQLWETVDESSSENRGTEFAQLPKPI